MHMVKYRCIFQNHFLRKHKDQHFQDVKDKHLVMQQPKWTQPTVMAQPGSFDTSVMENISEDGDRDLDDHLDFEDLPQEEDPYIRLKDDYGDFLGRLESVHHVSQSAVAEIAAEVFRLSNRVLANCLEKVEENLGKIVLVPVF